MEALNELVLNTNTLLYNVLVYAIPFVLIVFTLFIYSGLIDKLAKNMNRIVLAIIDFLEKLTTKKFKLSCLILTIVYCICVVLFLVLKD